MARTVLVRPRGHVRRSGAARLCRPSRGSCGCRQCRGEWKWTRRTEGTSGGGDSVMAKKKAAKKKATKKKAAKKKK
jgi:hypothetical protein